MYEEIKAEIERLKKELVWGACAAQIEMETNCKAEAYDEVLTFIESLPEEKPSEDLQKAAGEYIAPWLDKAYEKYGLPRQKSLSKFDAYDMEEAFEAGAQWQKEQMMKDAVDGKIVSLPGWNNVATQSDEFAKATANFKDGDKVKIIIIKEDAK